MTREEYLNKRDELMQMAENFLDENRIEESNQTMEEVEKLDSQYETERTARANMEALKNNMVVSASGSMFGVQEHFNSGPDAAAPDTSEDQLYCQAFYNYMTNRALSDEQQHVFDTVNHSRLNNLSKAEDNQVLVPESVVQQIWMEAENLHPVLADIGITTIPGDVTIIQDDDSAGTDAEWVDEDSSDAGETVKTVAVNLKGHELQKTITVSWKLRKMAMNDFLNYLAKKIGRKMGNALAAGYLTGKGIPSASEHKPQPVGMITAIEKEDSTPQVVTYSSSDALTYTKLTEAFGKIKSGYMAGSAVYANNSTIWNTLATLLDESGKPYFIPDPSAGGVGRLFGLIVKEESAVPENGILIGNPSEGYAANINENVSMYTEDHVKERTTDYVGYAIVDGNILTTKAFGYIKKS